jgi:hypothetical protein
MRPWADAARPNAGHRTDGAGDISKRRRGSNAKVLWLFHFIVMGAVAFGLIHLIED